MSPHPLGDSFGKIEDPAASYMVMPAKNGSCQAARRAGYAGLEAPGVSALFLVSGPPPLIRSSHGRRSRARA